MEADYCTILHETRVSTAALLGHPASKDGSWLPPPRRPTLSHKSGSLCQKQLCKSMVYVEPLLSFCESGILEHASHRMPK